MANFLKWVLALILWNFPISGELTDAFNTLENIDKVDSARPLDIFILWQNCIVWFVLHPTSDFMNGVHLICDHKQPKDIIRLGFFLLLLQSTSNLWCYFVFACLCWCCSLYRDSQQVRGPSAWSPSWTWWTTGRTRRTSWRTSCSHSGGVSARTLSPAHRSPLVVAGQLYTCAHAHICQPLKEKQGKRWKDKGEGGC